MNNGDTNTRDQGVIDAYRAASDALDEQPKAHGRAAILAAAARAVEAQPQDAATGATSRRFRPRERMSPIGPSRRPLALVASFLVATVALVIATQTDEQHDTRQSVEQAAAPRVAEAPAQAAPAAPAPMADADLEAKREGAGPTSSLARRDQAARSASQPAPVPAPEVKLAPPSPARRVAAEPAASPPVAPKVQEAPAREERTVADAMVIAKPAANAQVGRVASAEAPVVAALPPPPPQPATGLAAPAPPATPPAPAEQRAKENQFARIAPRADPRVPAEADAVSAGKLVKARPVERTAAITEGTAEIENDPARWMERIVALREASRDDEADRELARLRERYPDFKVAPNALRRTGTR